MRLVEVLGSEQHVYFSVDATPASSAPGAAATVDETTREGILASSAPNGVARLNPGSEVRPGSRVTFAVNPARLYFFDPDTGRAISLLTDWSLSAGRRYVLALSLLGTRLWAHAW